MSWQWDPNDYAEGTQKPGLGTVGLAPGSEDDFGTDGFTPQDYGMVPPAEEKKTDWASMLKAIFGGAGGAVK